MQESYTYKKYFLGIKKVSASLTIVEVQVISYSVKTTIIIIFLSTVFESLFNDKFFYSFYNIINHGSSMKSRIIVEENTTVVFIFKQKIFLNENIVVWKLSGKFLILWIFKQKL